MITGATRLHLHTNTTLKINRGQRDLTIESLHRYRQVAVPVAIVGLAVLFPPLQDNAPCNDFQDQGNGAQDADGNDVGRLPLLVDTQDGHSLEDVDDSQYDDGVTDGVMVNVPVEPVLVILLRPQEERKDLNGRSKCT